MPLNAAARQLLKDMLKPGEYEWKSDFAIQHRAEGRAEGKARAILVVLRTRGICVSDDTHERIIGCTDKEQLERWIERAVTVQTVDELFG